MPGHFLPTRGRFIAAFTVLRTNTWQVAAQTISNAQASTISTPQVAASTTAVVTSSTASSDSATSPSSSSSSSSTASSSSTVIILIGVVIVMLVMAGVAKRILKHRAAARALKQAKTSQVTNNYYMQAAPTGQTAHAGAQGMPHEVVHPPFQGNGTFQHSNSTEKLEAYTEQFGSGPQMQTVPSTQTWLPAQPVHSPWELPYYTGQATSGTAPVEQPRKKGWRLFR